MGCLSVLLQRARSSGPFYIPSPLLCLQVTSTFQHGQRASMTSVSSRTFGSFGDGFSMSKWEGTDPGGRATFPFSPLVARSGPRVGTFSRLETPFPQWSLLTDTARPGHPLTGAALTAGAGQWIGSHSPQRPPLLCAHGTLGPALPEPAPDSAPQWEPAGRGMW